MTDITPIPEWSPVRQIEVTDRVLGGPLPDGLSNLHAQALSNQNLYSRAHGGALPFLSGLSYPVGGLVKLASGSVVSSVVDDNIGDPNIDMTGWMVPNLIPSNNLSDLSSSADARENLDVFSREEVSTEIENATPDATETIAGKAKIATNEIAQAGINDTDFLTPKKLRESLNASGPAPVLACRALVVFNGLTSITVLKSRGVSSVVRDATGRYTITLANPLPDINPAVFGLSGVSSIAGLVRISTQPAPITLSTIQVETVNASNQLADSGYTSVGVFY